VAEDQKARDSTTDESQDPPWLKIITASAAIIAILAFFGVSNFTQLKHLFSSSGPSSAPSLAIPASHSPSDHPPSRPAPATSAESQGLSPSPVSDPDFVNTDLTPFTAASLLPQTFTDSVDGITYTLVASGGHPCNETSSMSSATAAMLTSNGCTRVMTGDYIEDDSSLDPGSHILVSVQIFPFASLSVAMQVKNDFPSGGAWDFGLYCPSTGLGSTTCDGDYPDAGKSESENYHHRYLVEATAVYVNLTTSTQVLPWLNAAAQAAVSACGPQNYPGNG
jgi:hypothetical protein